MSRRAPTDLPLVLVIHWKGGAPGYTNLRRIWSRGVLTYTYPTDQGYTSEVFAREGRDG